MSRLKRNFVFSVYLILLLLYTISGTLLRTDYGITVTFVLSSVFEFALFSMPTILLLSMMQVDIRDVTHARYSSKQILYSENKQKLTLYIILYSIIASLVVAIGYYLIKKPPIETLGTLDFVVSVVVSRILLILTLANIILFLHLNHQKQTPFVYGIMVIFIYFIIVMLEEFLLRNIYIFRIHMPTTYLPSKLTLLQFFFLYFVSENLYLSTFKTNLKHNKFYLLMRTLLPSIILQILFLGLFYLINKNFDLSLIFQFKTVSSILLLITLMSINLHFIYCIIKYLKQYYRREVFLRTRKKTNVPIIFTIILIIMSYLFYGSYENSIQFFIPIISLGISVYVLNTVFSDTIAIIFYMICIFIALFFTKIYLIIWTLCGIILGCLFIIRKRGLS